MTRLFVKTTVLLLAILASHLGSLSAQNPPPDVSTGEMPNPIGGRVEGFSGLGTRSGEFLSIPTSARGAALGEAWTAAADDIGSIFWNPAGLGFLDGPSFQFTNINLTLDFNYNYAAAAVPVKDGTAVVGGFFGMLTTNPIEITTLANPQGTGGYYDFYTSVMGGCLAYNISDRFSAGAGIKWVHEDIYDITSNAFSMDIGANYHTEFHGRQLRFALAVQNIGTNMKYHGKQLFEELPPEDEFGTQYGYGGLLHPERSKRYGMRQTTSFNLPTVFRIGLSYHLLETELHSLRVSGDFLQPNNVAVTWAAGAEYIRQLGDGYSVAGRFGWKFRPDEKDVKDENGTMLSETPALRGLSAGGGFGHDFAVFRLAVDYTYSHQGLLGSWQFITLNVSL
ncbi:MAG: PorV/PorQ family protein [Gemmatimonadota bacterium]|nr:PorV/PorQ family protein [Gemmatimonadota bacterium]